MQQSDNVVCPILILIALPFGLAAAKKARRDWKTGNRLRQFHVIAV
jgi:hypothetical protein